MAGASPKQNGKIELKRELGLFSAVNMILAVMIGSGIFISPASALYHSGSVGMCIIVWAVCGLISLLGALAFAELGTVVPRSGAEYAYFMDAFGPLHKFWGNLPAFTASWIYVVILRPAEVAVIVMTFAEYFCQPILDALCIKDEEYSGYLKKVVALLAMASITYINMSSVKLYVKLQNIFGACKVIACLIVIGGGIYELSIGNVGNLQKGFEGTNYHPANLALAFYSGLWAYDGWSTITTVTEEVKRPEVNIPRSIAISVPLVTLLYVFMNIAYMTVLPIPEMIQAQAVAVAFGERVLGAAGFLIPVGVALSTFGCALSVQFGVTRLCYVASQDGNMLKSMSFVHVKRLTPAPAVVTQGIITFIFIVIGNIMQLIEMASYLMWIFYGTAMVALLMLRKTMADVPRPYRVPTIIPIFIIIVAVFLSVVPLVTDPSFKYVVSILFILIGMVIYWWFIYLNKRPKFMDGFTRYIQILFQAVPPAVHVE
ncbi:b(0,+)-type amino acid transporter 1-like isoform X2 [Onthophagus taurus]|uniref:b(0,+)-type amino acid transporter 1-like isoform X2 n=1 Tax=Onthophagus taurus TaxID=166361 RepID=UPI0039BE34C4